MKNKLFSSLIASIFTFLLSGLIQPLYAAGPADQFCRTGLTPAWVTITNRSDHLWQSFTPVQNRLSRVVLDVNGDGIGQIKLKISTFLVSEENSNGWVQEPNGRGYVEFLFNDIALVPGLKYALTPIASDNSVLTWNYKTDCYSDGEGFMGSTAKTYDYGFETYGFTDEALIATPTQQPEQSVTSTPTSVITTAQQNVTATTSPTSNLPKDNSLVPPKLLYAIKNFETVSDVNESVNVKSGDVITLYGEGTTGSQIMISMGDLSTVSDVDKQGKWSSQIVVNENSSGDYTIFGKTISLGKSSEEIELLKLNYGSPLIEIADDNSFIEKYAFYVMATALILIGIASYMLWYFINKSKKSKTVDVKTENTTESDKNEGSGENPKDEVGNDKKEEQNVETK